MLLAESVVRERRAYNGKGRRFTMQAGEHDLIEAELLEATPESHPRYHLPRILL